MGKLASCGYRQRIRRPVWDMFLGNWWDTASGGRKRGSTILCLALLPCS